MNQSLDQSKTSNMNDELSNIYNFTNLNNNQNTLTEEYQKLTIELKSSSKSINDNETIILPPIGKTENKDSFSYKFDKIS